MAPHAELTHVSWLPVCDSIKTHGTWVTIIDGAAEARPAPSAFSLRGHRQQVQGLEREIRALRWAVAEGAEEPPLAMQHAIGPVNTMHARCGPQQLRKMHMVIGQVGLIGSG